MSTEQLLLPLLLLDGHPLLNKILRLLAGFQLEGFVKDLDAAQEFARPQDILARVELKDGEGQPLALSFSPQETA